MDEENPPPVAADLSRGGRPDPDLDILATTFNDPLRGPLAQAAGADPAVRGVDRALNMDLHRTGRGVY
jgi:hypothetical protein